MYITTDKHYLTYKINNVYYKIPTYGKIYKIIDFGRSIYTVKDTVICSDSFSENGTAHTQYNFEPFYNPDKPLIKPNYSFDLCRLACSIFDYLIDDLGEICTNEYNQNPVKKLVVEWCLDDRGLNMLYKSNGTDRYPEFKLYKMIAKSVHNHTPQKQLERPEFKKYEFYHKITNETIINIDSIPCYI